MQAIGKNIIVEHIDENIKTDSGLILSGEDAKQMRYGKAKVISPGTDVTKISAGDTIYYDKVQSFIMVVGEKQVTVIQERDVILVV